MEGRPPLVLVSNRGPVTFGPDGGYGHPDHIAVGQLTMAAIVCAADPSYAVPGGEPAHVGGGPLAVVHDEIGVLLADRRSADAPALEPERVDQAAGRVAPWVSEHAARRRPQRYQFCFQPSAASVRRCSWGRRRTGSRRRGRGGTSRRTCGSTTTRTGVWLA